MISIQMPPRNTIKEVIAQAVAKCIKNACEQHYPLRPIGEIAKIVSGGTPSTQNPFLWDGDIVWVTPKDLGRPHNIDITNSERRITREGSEGSSARILPVGTVLLSSRAPIGYLGISAVPLATNQGFKNIICGSSLDNRYLFHMLRGSINDLQSSGRGNTFSEISTRIVERYTIPVPPVNLQRALATFLDLFYQRLAGESVELPTLLAPLAEQQRIAAKIERLAAKIEEVNQLRKNITEETTHILLSVFRKIIEDTKYVSMSKAAPIVRRPVNVTEDGQYLELGIRSFGNGTFHKPALSGLEVGSKRLFHINPGDLLFSNVFAWEGAIAVAQPADAGRVGSHRFITCVPCKDVATPEFLCFYFLTPEGMTKIGHASPGGAGRNRTLGLDKLEQLEVPVPDYRKQLWFNRLQASVQEKRTICEKSQNELDALLPSILDKAFKGEL